MFYIQVHVKNESLAELAKEFRDIADNLENGIINGDHCEGNNVISIDTETLKEKDAQKDILELAVNSETSRALRIVHKRNQKK